MAFNLRRLFIGLIVLAGLLGAYLLYTRVSGTPPIDVNVAGPSPGPRSRAADANAEQIGNLADVEVLAVKRTRLVHTNENNEVDRELRFEDLLHREKNQWEITNPFMKLYLPRFQCEVTADRGRVQLETAYGQLVPDDAEFEGNVVIHIIPAEPNDPAECFIHLDDISFIADQSLFSSRRSVTLISRVARLTGTGIELLYDSPRSRLELFRIIELDSLRLRSDQFRSISQLIEPQGQDAAGASPARESTGHAPTVRSEAAESGEAPPPGDVYACVFRENVTITTPEQTVAARELLAINNILWSVSGPADETDPPDEAPAAPADPNAPEVVPLPGPDALDVTPSQYLAFDSIPEEFYDIVVTCDAGLVVSPMGSERLAADPCTAETIAPAGPPPPAPVEPLPDRQHARARRIEVDVATSDATLVGPVEMVFMLDPNDLTTADATAALMPVTISAQEAVRFVAASNQILFDGGCRATARRTEPNATTDFELTAPAFTLELVDTNDGVGLDSVAIRRFAAGGGQATVLIHRRAGGELIGWTEIVAARLDYDAQREFFTAYGPGMVVVHNARGPAAPLDPNALSLDRPCYAFLREFDTLVYSASSSQIVAVAEPQRVLLDYIPIVDGRYGDAIKANAGFIELALTETDDERVELAFVTASGGVHYEDPRNRVRGEVLFYDHTTSVVTVEGNEARPCYFNDTPFDQIEMNVKTGRIKTGLTGPGVAEVTR
jgi:hypothetical protein